MAGLGFLGGLGVAVAAGQQGYDRAQDRDYMNQQRAFQKTQQQRQLDEQKRDDEYRTGMQGVQTTETVENPATQTMYGKQAPVVRDDEGNLMPGAVETPAEKVTRQRNKDDVYADYAAMARKAGKMDLAMKFEDDADKASHLRASSLFQQWSSSLPDNADLLDAANQAKDIYNSDRLPGKVKGIQPNEDGTVTVQMFNSSSGQTLPKTFKSVGELKAGMESYFSPDTYNAYIKSKRDAAIKAQEKIVEEQAKGHVVGPGGAFVPGAGDARKPFVNNNGMSWNGEYNPDGSPTMVRAGAGGRSTGTGAGGKAPKEDIDSATTLLKDSLGKSDGTPEGAQRYTRAVSYLDGIYASNSNISPRTAAAIAADASADPTKVTMQIDNRTGLVSKVYRNPDFDGGKPYNLAPNSASISEMEKSVGPKGMQTAVTGMINTMLDAAPPEQRDATRTQLIQIAANPSDRKAYLEAAGAAGKDVDALSRQLDLIGKYSPPPAPTKQPSAKPTSVGGMGQYTPDPSSPAGRARARQEELRLANEKKDQARLAAQQATSKQFQADKKTMNPIDLVRKYQDSDLPVADMRELRSINY